MSEVLLVNPRKRTRRKKPRTAAQKAATRKLVAMNRKRVAPKRRRRNPIAGLAPNPKRRRRRNMTMAKKTYRRRRSNPITGRGIINRNITPAFQSALGALGLDILWGYAPVPADWKVGQFRHLIKGAGALAGGMLAKNVIGAAKAHTMTNGALTVIMHTAMAEFVQSNVPQVQLGYYSPGVNVGVGEYLGEYTANQGMGAYIGGSGSSPYLAKDTLSKPFAGPSRAQMVETSCLESEHDMGQYY